MSHTPMIIGKYKRIRINKVESILNMQDKDQKVEFYNKLKKQKDKKYGFTNLLEYII